MDEFAVPTLHRGKGGLVIAREMSCAAVNSTFPCCIPGCGNVDIKAFLFPFNLERKKWLTALKIKDFDPPSDSMVCIEHFSKDSVIIRKEQDEDGSFVETVRLASGTYPLEYTEQQAACEIIVDLDSDEVREEIIEVKDSRGATETVDQFPNVEPVQIEATQEDKMFGEYRKKVADMAEKEQQAFLLDWMLDHPGIAASWDPVQILKGSNQNSYTNEWESLCDVLNQLNKEKIKSCLQWIKVWTNWKYYAYAMLSLIGTRNTTVKLSYSEVKIFELLASGEKSIESTTILSDVFNPVELLQMDLDNNSVIDLESDNVPTYNSKTMENVPCDWKYQFLMFEGNNEEFKRNCEMKLAQQKKKEAELVYAQNNLKAKEFEVENLEFQAKTTMAKILTLLKEKKKT